MPEDIAGTSGRNPLDVITGQVVPEAVHRVLPRIEALELGKTAHLLRFDGDLVQLGRDLPQLEVPDVGYLGPWREMHREGARDEADAAHDHQRIARAASPEPEPAVGPGAALALGGCEIDDDAFEGALLNGVEDDTSEAMEFLRNERNRGEQQQKDETSRRASHAYCKMWLAPAWRQVIS